MTSTAPPPRRRGRGVAIAIALLVGVGLVVAAPWDPSRRQLYTDQWTVWTDPPSADIEALADDLTLTETGRRIFFASKPLIEPGESFSEHCDVEASIVLGCYHQKRIYVFAVTDDRLVGTVEVTAAHELLHAVYNRMTADERDRIDALVAARVATLPEDDKNVLAVADYPEPQHADEWHSRLGTSVTELSDELEAHYAEIFEDRTQILGFDRQSTAAIDDYSNRIEELSAELDAARASLETRSAEYDAAAEKLSADITHFNAHVNDFTSTAEYETARQALLDRQAALETERLSLNEAVAAYNATREELMALDAERAALYAELDRRSAS